jgi:hypothetical protein
MAGVSVELETFQRLGRMLRAFEGSGGGPPSKPKGDLPAVEVSPPYSTAIIQVTGAISGSYYPVNVVWYDSGSWTSLGSAQCLELNAKLLISGRRYFGILAGDVTVSSVDYPLFAVYSPGEVVTDISCSGGSLSVTKTKV